MIRVYILSLLLNTFALAGISNAQLNGVIYDGHTLQIKSIDEAVANVRPGQIVILGEQHGQMEQARIQMQILEKIKENGNKVSLGMEFFEYQYQERVNQYRLGLLPEDVFLKEIGWGKGFPFAAYKQQVNFPNLLESSVIALNTPRFITSKISKSGINSLTNEEKAYLPSDFEIGNASYFERFSDIMSGHIPSDPDLLNNYFAAQSAWDDTMAWKATEFIKNNPHQVLVIIVGEFHVQYGGGLPDRIHKRGVSDILTFSLLNSSGMDQDDLKSELLPNKYGKRSDYIWIKSY